MSERRCLDCQHWIEWSAKKCPHCGAEYDLQGVTGPKESYISPSTKKSEETPDTKGVKGGKKATPPKPAKKPSSKKAGKGGKGEKPEPKKRTKKGSRPSNPHPHTTSAPEVTAEAAPVPSAEAEATNGNGNGNGNGHMPEQHDAAFRRMTKAGTVLEWTEDEPDKDTIKTIDHLTLRKMIVVTGKKERLNNGGEGPVHCTVTEKGREWIEGRQWPAWEEGE